MREFLENYGFLRVQRSHLINLSFVQTYYKGTGKIIMSDGSEVPISHMKKEDLMRFLLKE